MLQLGSMHLPLGGVTHVVGVVNVSPESRVTHTVARSVDEVRAMADQYRHAGASIIDLGGQSSYHENPTIPVADEIARVVPAIEALVADGHLVSIDTWKPSVAAAAIDAGAVLVNDTGGLADPAMRRVVAARRVAAVAVYIEAEDPHTVGAFGSETDKVGHIAEVLDRRLADLAADGVVDVIVDPGIALSYRGDYEAYSRQQWRIVEGLERLRALGRPVMVPIPRKVEPHRVAAYITLALEHGADLIRVHDVEMAGDLVHLFDRVARPVDHAGSTG
jgi:dihydropteroate synthase